MKIIDLLNKIANDEKVPKIVKYDSVYYTYDKGHYTWFEDLDCVSYDLAADGNLNDEVEIIEDGNKIEKIERLEYSTNFNKEEFILYKNILAVNSNLNDVIDEINKLKEDK